MYKLTTIALFTTILSYAQIDYKSLIKNLEDITNETDLKEYFEDLPSSTEYDNLVLNDERFLRFHSIIIDKVTFSNGWYGKTMTLKTFNKKEDYLKLKTELSNVYEELEIDEQSNSIIYNWKTTNKKSIQLEIELEEGEFKTIESLTVSFNTI